MVSEDQIPVLYIVLIYKYPAGRKCAINSIAQNIYIVLRASHFYQMFPY